jgi:hypothetical protein
MEDVEFAVTSLQGKYLGPGLTRGLQSSHSVIEQRTCKWIRGEGERRRSSDVSL